MTVTCQSTRTIHQRHTHGDVRQLSCALKIESSETPDPAGMAAADLTNPQSLNRYAYVLNNPLSYVDPLGLDVFAIGNCYFDRIDYYVDGEYQGTDIDFIGCAGGGGGGGGGGRDVGGGGGGGGGGNNTQSPKPQQPPKPSCINRQALPFTTRATLSVLGAAAKRSGGVRGVGVAAAGAFSPPSLAGGGASVQGVWVADQLGQQGLYWSVSAGPTVGQAGAGWIVGVQYLTSTTNRNVVVNDVVNSSVSVGYAAGAGLAAGVDVSPQTGVMSGTVGVGMGGWGGSGALNLGSGFIPICRE